MGKEILTSADIEIESPILLKVVDIETLLLSNLTSFGENNYKYFISYLYNDDNIKP